MHSAHCCNCPVDRFQRTHFITTTSDGSHNPFNFSAPFLSGRFSPIAAARVLEAQRAHWGAPLVNHLVYARRPDLFRAARGMWTGLNRDRVLDEALVALLNRRVASLNGCEF